MSASFLFGSKFADSIFAFIVQQSLHNLQENCFYLSECILSGKCNEQGFIQIQQRFNKSVMSVECNEREFIQI